MKLKNVILNFVSGGLILLLSASCSAVLPKSAPTTQPLPTTGVEYYFVTDKLQLPVTSEQVNMFSLNVDGDSKNIPDNKFGDLLTLITSASQGIQLQAMLDLAIVEGQLVSLHVLKANDPLNDTSVSWSILVGESANSAPKFDGADIFKIDPSAPIASPIIGSLTDGRFKGGPGKAKIKIFFLGQPAEVDLIGVRLEADVNASGCANGKLGGGITVEEFNYKILPAMVEGLNQAIKTDLSTANAVLPLFDSDNNGVISVKEFEGNPMLMMAVSPDLDLLDASGTFNPNQDGVKDSYSMGLGFTCLPAVFTAPEN